MSEHMSEPKEKLLTMRVSEEWLEERRRAMEHIGVWSLSEYIRICVRAFEAATLGGGEE